MYNVHVVLVVYTILTYMYIANEIYIPPINWQGSPARGQYTKQGVPNKNIY